jgi:hypothetical protein
MSAANLPTGSGDYGYADACTKQGAYYHPVKQRPPMPLEPTPTPGRDGHVPLSIPVNPPPGEDSKLWAAERADCQEIADDAFAGRPAPKRLDSMLEVCESLGGIGLSWPTPVNVTTSAPSQTEGAPISTVTPTPTTQ